jgi:hypothetical protein
MVVITSVCFMGNSQADSDYCSITTSANIMKRFPSLEVIWDAKIRALDQNEAKYNADTAKLKKLSEKGPISEMEYLVKDGKLTNRWDEKNMEIEWKYMEKFDNSCKQLLKNQ